MQCLCCETRMNKFSHVKQPYALSVDFRPQDGILCLYLLREELMSCLHYFRIGVQYFIVPSAGGCCVFSSIPAKHFTKLNCKQK